MQAVLLFHTHVPYGATRMLRRSFAVRVSAFSRTQAVEERALFTGVRQLESRLPASQTSQMYHLHIRRVPEGLEPQQVKNSRYLNLGATHHLANHYQRGHKNAAIFIGVRWHSEGAFRLSVYATLLHIYKAWFESHGMNLNIYCRQ